VPIQLANPFQRVLIAVDGSRGSFDASVLARQLAGRAAELTLVHVQQTSEDRPAPGSSVALHQAWELLDAVSRESGIAPTLTLACGSVTRGLAELAASLQADLLVVGSNGGAAAGRVMLGATIEELLLHAPCPVAIAPVAHVDTTTVKSIGVGYDASSQSQQALALALALAVTWSAELELAELQADAAPAESAQLLGRLSRSVDLLVVSAGGNAGAAAPGGRLALEARATIAHAPLLVVSYPAPSARGATLPVDGRLRNAA
jgi:nucleotide-binding universal stress UspA family protein